MISHQVTIDFGMSETDHALLMDALSQDGINIVDFARNEVVSKIERLVQNRKREIGQVLALTGQVDEKLVSESKKLTEARKSPW